VAVQPDTAQVAERQVQDLLALVRQNRVILPTVSQQLDGLQGEQQGELGLVAE
jgi:hypothetical protein